MVCILLPFLESDTFITWASNLIRGCNSISPNAMQERQTSGQLYMHLTQNDGKGALQIQVHRCQIFMSWMLCHLDQIISWSVLQSKGCHILQLSSAEPQRILTSHPGMCLHLLVCNAAPSRTRRHQTNEEAQSASQAAVLQNGRACRLLEVMVSNVLKMAAKVGVPVIHPSAPHQRQHSALIIRQRPL